MIRTHLLYVVSNLDIYSCVSLKSCYKLNLFSRYTEPSSGNKCDYLVNILSRTKNYSIKIWFILYKTIVRQVSIIIVCINFSFKNNIVFHFLKNNCIPWCKKYCWYNLPWFWYRDQNIKAKATNNCCKLFDFLCKVDSVIKMNTNSDNFRFIRGKNILSIGKFAFNARLLTTSTMRKSSYICLQQWNSDILGHKGQSWKVKLLQIGSLTCIFIFYSDFSFFLNTSLKSRIYSNVFITVMLSL